MNRSDIYKDTMLFYRVESCISSDNEQEYMNIADELTSSSAELLSAVNFFGDFSTPFKFQFHTRGMIISDFLRSFALKFPDRFRQYDYSMMPDALASAAAGEIMLCSPAAYPLIDAIQNSFINNDQTCSEIINAAVISENYEVFEYIIGVLKDPLEKVSLEFVLYLYDKKKYDLIGQLFANASRENISRFFRSIRFSTNQYLLSLDRDENNIVDVIYDIALRFFPKGVFGDDDREAVTAFFNESGIGSVLIGLSEKEIWEKIKAYGIKIWDISFMVQSFELQNLPNETFREYILPILEDKVYIDAVWLLHNPFYRSNDAEEKMKLIGFNRVVVELNDGMHGVFEREEKLDIIWILNRGADLRLNLKENIKDGDMIYKIMNTPNILEYILKKNKFSETQLDALIELCIEKKRLDTLNIIRRYNTKKT